MGAARTTGTTTIGPGYSITHHTPGPDPQIASTLFDPVERTRQQRVVFLNGAAHQQNCWQRQAVSLAERGVSSISLNYRGHGESTWSQPDQQARLDDEVADEAAVLELEAPHDLMVNSDWQRAAEAVWAVAQQCEQAQTSRQGASAC